MDMSNKSLALLLVAAIVISLGGTIISVNELTSKSGVTGYATGRVNLTLGSTPECVVVQNVSFGSGDQPSNEVNLSTDIDNSANSFNNCVTNAACRGLQIENTGNADLEVNLTSDIDGSDLGGSGASVDDAVFWVRNGTYAGAEEGCHAGISSSWLDLTVERPLCTNLTYEGSDNSITGEFNITIDENTPPGNKIFALTIDCAEAD